MRILLGPAGSPAESTMEGLGIVSSLGLAAMEVAFTHGVKMSTTTAKQVSHENKKYNISLSIHAPYYINLNSVDREKVKASRQRILDACERGHYMGARKIVFHAGYYGKMDKEQTYGTIKHEICTLIDEIKKNSWDVELLPETAGKLAQFGDINEIIGLSKEAKCGLCIDLAHIYARNTGKIDFSEIFDKLGGLRKSEFHFHFSGVNYGPRGERNHLVLGESPDFEEFASELMKRDLSATIISESPITWKDSLKMKNIFIGLGYSFV